MEEHQRQNEALQAMMNVKYYPTFEDADVDASQYTKVPWAELTALGAGFASLPASMRTITEVFTTNLGPDVYRRVDGLNMGLVQVKDMPGFCRGVAKDGSHLNGATIFQHLSDTETVRNVTVPYDPTTMLMAAALISINQKLDEILDTEKDIFDYLQQQNRAKLKGNLQVLSDVMNNYKFNWDNQMYKTNMHVKVLDIKQDAAQSIMLYRGQIEKRLGKRSFLHSDQEVQKKLQAIQADLKDYQMALYIFGFAAFLEVVLLGNFQKDYLDEVASKIEEYSIKYRELYTECYDKLELESSSSLQTALLGGVAHLTKGAGDVIAKIPVISRGQLDETLIGAGEKLGKTKDSKANKTVQTLISGQAAVVKPFIDNIHSLAAIYNEPIEFFIDKDNVYLSLPQTV